jgi:hypothetical protein
LKKTPKTTRATEFIEKIIKINDELKQQKVEKRNKKINFLLRTWIPKRYSAVQRIMLAKSEGANPEKFIMMLLKEDEDQKYKDMEKEKTSYQDTAEES